MYFEDNMKSGRGERPITPRYDSVSSVTSLSPIQDIDDDEDDLALPGSLNDNVLNQKFKRMQEAAQKSRPTSRGGMGIVQSSRPLSARGSQSRGNTSARGYLAGPPSSTSASNPLNYSANPSTPRQFITSNPLSPEVELLDDVDTMRSARMQPPQSAAVSSHH